jgi:MYXO-CTERM domain-containing protein
MELDGTPVSAMSATPEPHGWMQIAVGLLLIALLAARRVRRVTAGL